MGQWFQRFVTSGLHGEVSDATIQGYLRSAGQIEEVWQQIDDSVETLIAQGMAPWMHTPKWDMPSRSYVLAVRMSCLCRS